MADWLDNANCKGMDPSLFHPVRHDMRGVAEAKAVCAGCEVSAECLTWALDNNERTGIWGGTSEKERRQLRKAHPPKPKVVRCGTPAAYRAHLRRGEAPCWSCRAAMATERLQSKERNRESA